MDVLIVNIQDGRIGVVVGIGSHQFVFIIDIPGQTSLWIDEKGILRLGDSRFFHLVVNLVEIERGNQSEFF